ncbi:hypothetical protein ABT072_13115 [Streptomyces sp. NPDC002589]|uniref:hypothetical protein n=1 Tax=Streptomyces sp. NPDC002589 TaxID=3154420 RepID=UPI003326C81B
MSPIPAQSGPDDPEGGASGVRRGRHRKPRPRKVLLAAGGLALAAGVLSLVRVTPDPGAGSPGTAEAEPRLGTSTSDGGTDHPANTAATAATAPTALPSATSAMGGRSLAPTTGTRPRTPPAPSAGTTTPPPTTLPSGPPATTPHSPEPTSAPPTPRPTPTTPAPSHSTTPPGPGGLCVPMLGICVSLRDGTSH